MPLPAPWSRPGKSGSSIDISSIEGSRAAPYYSVYAACKAAMENFTRTVAVEFDGGNWASSGCSRGEKAGWCLWPGFGFPALSRPPPRS